MAASCAVPYICTRMDESVSSSSRLSVTGWTNSASAGDGIGGLAAAVVDWWWCGWCKASGSVAFSYPCLNQVPIRKAGNCCERQYQNLQVVGTTMPVSHNHSRIHA